MRKGRMKADKKNEILENVWTLFRYIEDKDDPDLVKAVHYFQTYHNFDIEELPHKLYGAAYDKHIDEMRISIKLRLDEGGFSNFNS